MNLEQLTTLPPDTRLSLKTFTGWIDSFQIAPDESRLYFFAMRYDVWKLLEDGTMLVSSGGFPGHRGNRLGDSPLYDGCLFEAILTNGEITAINSFSFNSPDLGFSAPHFVGTPGSRTVYFSYLVSGTQYRLGKMVENGVDQWGPLVTDEFANIHAAFSDLGDSEDNVWVNADEDLLFFESDQAGGTGTRNIWMSVKSNGVWGTPTEANINGVDGNTHFFMINDTDAYFTRSGSLYHSTFDGSTFSGTAAVTIPGATLPLYVGEWTIPDDFSKMYFLHLDATNKRTRILIMDAGVDEVTWGTPYELE